MSKQAYLLFTSAVIVTTVLVIGQPPAFAQSITVTPPAQPRRAEVDYSDFSILGSQLPLTPTEVRFLLQAGTSEDELIVQIRARRFSETFTQQLQRQFRELNASDRVVAELASPNNTLTENERFSLQARQTRQKQMAERSAAKRREALQREQEEEERRQQMAAQFEQERKDREAAEEKKRQEDELAAKVAKEKDIQRRLQTQTLSDVVNSGLYSGTMGTVGTRVSGSAP